MSCLQCMPLDIARLLLYVCIVHVCYHTLSPDWAHACVELGCAHTLIRRVELKDTY